jgi:hypothetical protein
MRAFPFPLPRGRAHEGTHVVLAGAEGNSPPLKVGRTSFLPELLFVTFDRSNNIAINDFRSIMNALFQSRKVEVLCKGHALERAELLADPQNVLCRRNSWGSMRA